MIETYDDCIKRELKAIDKNEINQAELNVALSEKVIELNDLRRDLVDTLKTADKALEKVGQDVQSIRKAIRDSIERGSMLENDAQTK